MFVASLMIVAIQRGGANKRMDANEPYTCALFYSSPESNLEKQEVTHTHKNEEIIPQNVSASPNICGNGRRRRK
jgi:hypothetical protein